mgnify:CR=1 FL=1
MEPVEPVRPTLARLRDLGCHLPFLVCRGERGVEIAQQIVDVFDADREAHGFAFYPKQKKAPAL